jgi:hypothetical protein
MNRSIAIGLLVFAVAAGPAVAGEPAVIAAKATPEPGGTYRFAVTVRHADAGWNHYADKWDVVAPDGTVLATRVLVHPHEDEQPFTRDQGGVRVPAGVRSVVVRAHDKVHGYGTKTATVDLPGR